MFRRTPNECDMQFNIMATLISSDINNIMTSGQFIIDYTLQVLKDIPLDIKITVKNGKYSREYKPANICEVTDTHSYEYIRPSSKYTVIVKVDEKHRKLMVIAERYDG